MIRELAEYLLFVDIWYVMGTVYLYELRILGNRYLVFVHSDRLLVMTGVKGKFDFKIDIC